MSDYLTLEMLHEGEHPVIDRVTFSHILLASMYNMVPVIKDRCVKSVDGLSEERKDYLLMKKSWQSRWGDISFYNFNEDIEITARNKSAITIDLPFDGKSGKSVSLDSTNSESYEELYRLMITSDKVVEKSIYKLRKFLSKDYNIYAEAFNLDIIQSDKAVYYIKFSRTEAAYTIYFFFFYAPRKYAEIREAAGFVTRTVSLGKNTRKLLDAVNANRNGFFANVAEGNELRGFEIANDRPAAKWLKAGAEVVDDAKSSMLDFFNAIQADQLVELASRGSSAHIPKFFFGSKYYRMLNPRYRMHSVVDRLNEGYAILGYLTGDMPLFDLDVKYEQSPSRREKSSDQSSHRPMGFMMIDLIGCKRFYNQSADYSKGIDALKAFQNEAADIIHRFSGYVVQTAGDGIYAIVELPGSGMPPGRHGRNEHKRSIYGLMLKIAALIQETGWETRIGMDFSRDVYYEGILGPLELNDNTITGVNVNIASRLEGKIKDLELIQRGILLPSLVDITDSWIRIKLEELVKDGDLAVPNTYVIEQESLEIHEAMVQDPPLQTYWHIYNKNWITGR